MSAFQPRVVIVGAGFAGLSAAKALRRVSVQVTVVDQHDYHTFKPFLYQVATALLGAGASYTYTLSGDGPPVQIGHRGRAITLTDGCAETREIPPLPTGPSRPSRPGANPPAGRRQDHESAVTATGAPLLTPRA
jgi:choline dehydrogenase-like flavoprotein